MEAQMLTDASVRRLKTNKNREDVGDARVRGLHLRVYQSGRKVWRMRYRWRGKRPIMTLGEYPIMGLREARQAVLEAQERIADGLDPAAESQRQQAVRTSTPTANDFAVEYIQRHAKPNKASWAEDQRNLEKNVLPYIGKMRMDEIHRRDIVAIIDRIRDRGAPVQANAVLAVVRKMFNFAVERGVLESAPTQQIKQSRVKSRDVILTDDELRQLWAITVPFEKKSVALPMHHVTRCALRLVLLTGARNSEVCGIAATDLDLKRKIWTHESKNGIIHTVPLTDMAMAVILDAMEVSDGRFLFTSNSKGGHITKYAMAQAMRKIFNGQRRPHDLRRTVGTRISALGFNRLIVDKVLNHKDNTVGGIYDRHTYDKEKREALTAWAHQLQSILIDE